MRTLEDIRLEKGFKTASSFAEFLEITQPHYSQMVNGLRIVNRAVIHKLKQKFPNDNFDDFIDQLRERIGKPVSYDNRVVKHSFVSEEKILYKQLPVVRLTDRHTLNKIVETKFEGLSVYNVPITSLMNPRNDYFVLEAGIEAFVSDSIKPGDFLLAYFTPKESWSTIFGACLIQPINKTAYIIKIDAIDIDILDGWFIYSDTKEGLTKVNMDTIESIYKIESIIYRKL